MDFEASQWTGRIAEILDPAIAYVANPWFAYQLLIVIALFGVSVVLGRRYELALEAKARQIKGSPDLLRLVVALMRRLPWICYVILLTGALGYLRGLRPGDPAYLVSTSLSLAAAWLVVSVASRIIRNRAIARLVQWLAWIYAALVIFDLDRPAAAALDRLALPLGTTRLSALLVLKSALVLVAAVWLAIALGNFLDRRVQRNKDLTPSFRVLIGKLLKLGLVLVAGAIGLSTIGVDLTAITVFSGAVGVGVGFGLQKVVSNFVSGIIILLDKSIKPGDTISLGDTFGWIRDLRARYVSVVTRDGREFLIPNEDFITEQVINWTFRDDLVRLDVKFGVSYDSDPHKVSELAIDAASSVARVDAQRRPVCWLTGFGESSLDFVLRFWIHDPTQGLTNVRGKVLLALWDTFKAQGIAIPYPFREVILHRHSRASAEA